MRAETRTAIEQGDVGAFIQLIEDDPSAAEARDAQGLSPLVYALYRGQTEIADYLLSLGPDLDLFEAAAVGYRARVAELLDGESKRESAGAASSVDVRSPDGYTPLQLAAFFGRASTVRLLLERRADVSAVSDNAMTIQPLHAAVANRHAEIADLLLASGADPNARQQGGWTPLHAAAQNGDAALVKLLRERGADPNAANDAGKTPRDLAGENVEIAGLLAG